MGARVRQLRLASGLTQADLAGRDFTKGFISLLETGRTRISLRAAEILAQRLGVNAGELIARSADNADLELALLRGEQEVSAGRGEEALEALERVASGATGLLRARALRARGRALVNIGRARDGLVLLEDAGHAFTAMRQRELHIRTLYDRALAYAHLNQPGATLTLALECDAEMRAGGLVDRTLELQVCSLLATAFARAGDLASSNLQADRALQLAADVVDREALAGLYSTISLTRQRQKDLDGAVSYARKSLALYEEVGRERSIGQTWHNLAAVYIDRGDFARAADALQRAAQVATSAKIPALQARVLTTRAELAGARKRWSEAETLGREGAELAGASDYTRARGLLVQARALAARKVSIARVRALLDEAARALKAEPPRVQAEIHEAHAAIMAARGDWHEAYEQANTALELMRPGRGGKGRT